MTGLGKTLVFVFAAMATPSMALGADFTALEASQNEINSKPGPRTVPGREIPVPKDVSLLLRRLWRRPIPCRPGTRTRQTLTHGVRSYIVWRRLRCRALPAHARRWA